MANLNNTSPPIYMNINPPADPEADTQPTYPHIQPGYSHAPAPTEPLDEYQPIRIEPLAPLPSPGRQPGRQRGCGCCLPLLLVPLLLVIYFILPIRTNIVLIGIDARTPEGAIGRSDTLVLVTIKPVGRYVGMLSIPRDLWVQVPGVGENRINTAHFFAEAAQPGSGPAAVKDVIQENFSVKVNYYARVSFDSFTQLIDTLGGVQITLTESMGGYPAGTHLLDAEQALAFARDRTSGGDDFSRMRQTQVLVRALVLTAVAPENIVHWPAMAGVILGAVETDIPIFWWPRLGAGLLFAFPGGIDGRVINREMVEPFTTIEGAQVLAPRWEAINPVIDEMFKK